jgi:hypothetical protein
MDQVREERHNRVPMARCILSSSSVCLDSLTYHVVIIRVFIRLTEREECHFIRDALTSYYRIWCSAPAPPPRHRTNRVNIQSI